MGNKRYIGMYFNEGELTERISGLKKEGWPEENIFVIVKDEGRLTMLQNRSDAEVQSADSSWSDRFIGFLTGENPVRRMVDKLQLGAQETEMYYRQIEDGGMLLYVDTGEAARHFAEDIGFYETDGAGADKGMNSLTISDQQLNSGDPAHRMQEILPDEPPRKNRQ